MAKATKWSNVQVSMQSAIAAAKTITGITKASPGVATSTAHGFSNGTYLALSVTGMRQVDDGVFRIMNVTANTYELEGVDTTDFDDFIAGTAALITLGTNVTTATTVSPSGGGFDMIDTTTIHGNQRTQIPGLPSASTYNFDNIWDISDVGLKAMKKAADAQQKRAFKFQFGVGGQIMVFYGYVGANLLPGGQGQGLVTTPTTITMNSTPNYYAS